jgi:hypothetical protein
MKTQNEIEQVLSNLPENPYKTKFASMTYEQGIDEALNWVLGEISDEEFEYGPKNYTMK